MKSSKKLIFFGNERLATAVTTTAPTLQALISTGYEIVAVIASHTDSVSRQKRDLEIGLVARSHGIPVILSGKIDLSTKVKRHQTDAAVLVAFGKLIPQAVIDLFPKGIINIHPSLLPKLRGPTPVETAILDGVTETGVSLMRLSAKMDAGPVFIQKRIAIEGAETKQELADKLLNEGVDLLIKNLPAILEGTLKPKPQIDTQATYTKLFKKEDGVMDFGQPAEILERQVRAYSGWPKSQAKIFGHQVIVTKAHIAKDKKDGNLVMKCLPAGRQASPSYLEILELVGPSGKTMSGADFLRGYSRPLPS